MCSIFGYLTQNYNEDKIIESISLCMLYHFFISDLSKENEKKGYFDLYNPIGYKSKTFKDSDLINRLNFPDKISSTITKEIFADLINNLINERLSPHERWIDEKKTKKKRNKRRQLRFYEKTLLFYYYKESVPVNYLNKKFSIEHIIPNSSNWEGEIDKDRIGNMIPILDSINCSRGNKHIERYLRHYESNFTNFISDIIPNKHTYDQIIIHGENNVPKIINNNKYNKLCDNNEEKYINNFIEQIF